MCMCVCVRTHMCVYVSAFECMRKYVSAHVLVISLSTCARDMSQYMCSFKYMLVCMHVSAFSVATSYDVGAFVCVLVQVCVCVHACVGAFCLQVASTAASPHLEGVPGVGTLTAR
jgi:hypothetical protein